MRLIPKLTEGWRKTEAKTKSYKNVILEPFLYFNKFNHDQKYKVKFQIKPLGSKLLLMSLNIDENVIITEARRNMAFLSYQDVETRTEGFKARGAFITSNNYKNVQDKDGAITLKLKVNF